LQKEKKATTLMMGREREGVGGSSREMHARMGEKMTKSATGLRGGENAIGGKFRPGHGQGTEVGMTRGNF